MKDAIIVNNLKKSYGSHAVLKGISFSVKQGEIFALLGTNGAGKTTTLECVEGLRRYDEGEIVVDGKIGIQLQSSSLQSFIRPTEAVKLFALWNKASPDERQLKELGIYEFAKKKYCELSTGQKRRLHLALALIGDPDIIFLDEPTAGLDVEGKLSLHKKIKELKAQGKTIILASHDMAEVEQLSDTIAILKDGMLAFTGSVEQLTQVVGRRHSIQITTTHGQQIIETDNLTKTLLEKLEEYRRDSVDILDIKTDRGTLEEHFMSIAAGRGQ